MDAYTLGRDIYRRIEPFVLALKEDLRNGEIPYSEVRRRQKEFVRKEFGLASMTGHSLRSLENRIDLAFHTRVELHDEDIEIYSGLKDGYLALKSAPLSQEALDDIRNFNILEHEVMMIARNKAERKNILREEYLRLVSEEVERRVADAKRAKALAYYIATTNLC